MSSAWTSPKQLISQTSLLVHKLDHYGIQASKNTWDHREAVVMDCAKSDYISVRSEVPQGSVLGPCLFQIYINDLQDRVTSLSRLFADDTILHHLITCMQEPVVLQEDLHKLEA